MEGAGNAHGRSDSDTKGIYSSIPFLPKKNFSSFPLLPPNSFSHASLSFSHEPRCRQPMSHLDKPTRRKLVTKKLNGMSDEASAVECSTKFIVTGIY
jgi:hypothetical protein